MPAMWGEWSAAFSGCLLNIVVCRRPDARATAHSGADNHWRPIASLERSIGIANHSGTLGRWVRPRRRRAAPQAAQRHGRGDGRWIDAQQGLQARTHPGGKPARQVRWGCARPLKSGGAHRGGIWPGPAQAPVSAYLAEAASAGAAAGAASAAPDAAGAVASAAG